MMLLRKRRRLGGELLVLRPGGEAVMGLGVVDNLPEQFLAERGQRTLPQLPCRLALFDEAPFLRGDGAGIHAVGEVIDGAARDRIAFPDGPFHRRDAAMSWQQRGVVADTAELCRR